MSLFTTRKGDEYWVRFSWPDVWLGGLRRLLKRYEELGWTRSHIVETPGTSQRFTYVLVPTTPLPPDPRGDDGKDA